MTNPYRWGDVPPTAVAELKSRRKSRPAAAVPPHLVVPASRIDIDALLATTGWISPAARRSPPVGRLARTSIVFREWAGILNLSAGQVPDRFGTVRRTGHGLAAQ